jgi:aminopeptidase S
LSDSQRQQIHAYINLDMVGSPNAGLYVYEDNIDGQTTDISEMIFNALEAQGARGVGIPSGGSDHIAFWQAGIPFGGVFSGIAPLSEEEAVQFGGEADVPADPCYHRPCDDRTNVDTATARLFGQAVAAVVEDLAY